MNSSRHRIRGLLVLLAPFAVQAAYAQSSVGLTGGTPPVQTFDSLASTGTGSTLPEGWYFVKSNGNTTYTADNGAANSGNTYSYGSAGSSERALGVIRSNSNTSTIGARLRNDTTAALSEIAVAYTGEQWRLGATGRADQLQFEYSLDATSVTTGTWTPVAALHFSSPTTTGAVGALDGNAAANRTAISGSITGLNLGPGAGLWVRWNDIDVTGSDDGLAIDDVSFAVAGDPPVDLPPTVASTTPANGATGVALASTLSVTFSEPVDVTAPWYTIDCATSGAHTAAVSGGPTTYTLTPSPAFSAAESCEWKLLATGIVDRDGTPEPMANDVTIAFTTFDPANVPPPTVSSVQPANGATQVPVATDVRVTFSESVTTASNAFALACNSTPVTLGVGGTGATRTLTPATVLPANASCTFSITASGVQNGAGIAMANDFTSSFTVAANTTAAYYSRVNTSSPGQLRCSLHATIRGHTAYPYSGSGTNTWTILELAQVDPANPNRVIDVYRNRSYAAVSDRAGTGGGITYNREHTWPNSLGFPSTNGNLGLPNAPYTDTHMLWLSDTNQNSSRGNKPFANCASGCSELATEANGGVGGPSTGHPGNSNWVRTPDGNQGSFEVWNHRKGEMARAIFYMAIRYEGGVDPTSGQNEPQLELTDNRSQIVQSNNYSQTAYMGLLADLLAWHLADPPDAAEVARNNVIQSFQGNRNPFVDHPEWATRALFESVSPTTCELASGTVDVIFANGFEATP